VECVCYFGVCSVNACMLIYCYCLPVLDSNDHECTKEGEVFQYEKEDQGQANQGKSSNIVSSLILVLLIL
jgi:hypothetical protein